MKLENVGTRNMSTLMILGFCGKIQSILEVLISIYLVPLPLQNRGFSVRWFCDGSDFRGLSFSVDRTLQSTKIDDPVFWSIAQTEFQCQNNPLTRWLSVLQSWDWDLMSVNEVLPSIEHFNLNNQSRWLGVLKSYDWGLFSIDGVLAPIDHSNRFISMFWYSEVL